MINQEYKERVRLLLRIIPIISAEECFAVHGGTAINLFVQNLPRYSVDIDLTYIPVEPREASLAHIKERLKAIKAKIEVAIPGIAIREVPNKLICTHNGHFVKVEVNDVKRGIIAPPIELPLCDLAQEDFGVFCKARIVHHTLCKARIVQRHGLSGTKKHQILRRHPGFLTDLPGLIPVALIKKQLLHHPFPAQLRNALVMIRV